MRVVLGQINTTVGDIEGNCGHIIAALEKAQALGGELVVFPELALTGYPPRDLLGIHGFVECNLKALNRLAARTTRTGVIVGFVDRNVSGQGKDFFNAAALLADGRIQSIVHKTLLPTYDVFDEDRYFERNLESLVIPFKGRRLGISVCEDAWNAEDFWHKPLYPVDPIRRQIELGADLLINISASPFELHKPQFRYRMLLDHVAKHRLPLMYVNLVGGNDDLLFDGNSIALGRDGNLIAQGKSFAEDLLVVDSESESDRAYEEGDQSENLFRALIMGVRDYASKCGFRSAVLGLSGGIDSAVTACIAAAALGPENVVGVSMPSIYSAQESHDDARALAENLSIRFEVVPIQDLFQQYRSSLAGVFKNRPEDITEENLQARIRGTILMGLSNKFGHLVLSTGNKSELAVGYCTLYGDMAGGLAVISDVPKTGVYKLAHYINRDREIIPSHSITRPPSAELRFNQTDQDCLPEYDLLDAVLRLRIEEQLSVDEIVGRGYEPATVQRIVKMIQQSEYKRRQAAPGLKVTTRAFGTGRRMPIAMRFNPGSGDSC